MLNPKLPYIRAVESPLIQLSPTAMRDVVFKRHVTIDPSVNLDDMDALKALCSAHFEQCEGMIKQSKIIHYELHLKKYVSNIRVLKCQFSI